MVRGFHLRWCSGAQRTALDTSPPLLRAWKSGALVAILRPIPLVRGELYTRLTIGNATGCSLSRPLNTAKGRVSRCLKAKCRPPSRWTPEQPNVPEIGLTGCMNWIPYKSNCEAHPVRILDGGIEEAGINRR